jgi:hypothetical protein
MILNFIVEDKKNKIIINIFLSFILFFIFSFLDEKNIKFDKKELEKKIYLIKKYKWLNNNLYNIYYFRSMQFNVDIELALSIIYAESNGKKVVSRMNKNLTRDYGRMQINSIHLTENPYRLLDDKINSFYGFSYLSQCCKKSKNLKDIIRMYNQGIYGNKRNYNNWRYVEKILYCYNN